MSTLAHLGGMKLDGRELDYECLRFGFWHMPSPLSTFIDLATAWEGAVRYHEPGAVGG